MILMIEKNLAPHICNVLGILVMKTNLQNCNSLSPDLIRYLIFIYLHNSDESASDHMSKMTFKTRITWRPCDAHVWKIGD